MPAATAKSDKRRQALAELFRIYLRNYPEHIIAQAVRKAWDVLSVDPRAIHRAVLAGERHAKARMAAVRRAATTQAILTSTATK